MSRLNRKKLVLDASIALGSYDSMFNPASSLPGDANRRTLEAVWEEEHVAVFNRQLEREWRDHESPFATAWRGRMVLKNRTVTDEGSDFSPLLQVACDCLPNPEEKASLAKDFHLIQSALATGQLILSNEVRFPQLVARACPVVQQLAFLHYANPNVEGDACRLWIKAGAGKDAERRIDLWAESHCGSD